MRKERLNTVFGATLRPAPAVNTLPALFQALDPAALEWGPPSAITRGR